MSRQPVSFNVFSGFLSCWPQMQGSESQKYDSCGKRKRSTCPGLSSAGAPSAVLFIYLKRLSTKAATAGIMPGKERGQDIKKHVPLGVALKFLPGRQLLCKRR